MVLSCSLAGQGARGMAKGMTRLRKISVSDDTEILTYIDTYRASTIAGLSDSKFDTILKPSKPKKTLSNVTILGFDTEFTSDRRLLSVQLAGFVKEALVSTAFYTSELNKTTLFDLVTRFCRENGIDLAENVVLVAHFASAEISQISGFMKEFNLRTYNR